MSQYGESSFEKSLVRLETVYSSVGEQGRMVRGFVTTP